MSRPPCQTASGLLAAAIKTQKPNLKKLTKLTICEGEDGTGSSDGDVLIFPDLVTYKGLNDFNVENFVEEVLVKDTEWLPGSPVAMKDLDSQVFVSASSHVGGHKYVGNVIIFSSDAKGEATGHWYGYVTPDDVPVLLQKHIGQGEIVDHLWRGQMGLSEEQQKKALELRNMTNGGSDAKESIEATGTDGDSCNPVPAGGCCQGNGGGFTCCQSGLPKQSQDKSIPAEQSEKSSGKENGEESSAGSKKQHTKICSMPTWFKTWDRADTSAALAVVAAAASVFVAFRVYKNLN